MIAKSDLSTVALIPREILFGNPEKALPMISHDGKFLAYLAPDENNVLNVWVRTTGMNDDRMVSSDKDRGVRYFFWQMDSKHILYAQDKDGDEIWHVHQTNVITTETRNLTPFEGAQASVIALKPAVPDFALISSNKRDARFFDVYKLDLRDASISEVAQNPGDIDKWLADDELNIIVGQALKADGSVELRRWDRQQEAWHTFMSWGADESFGGLVGLSQDSNSVLALSSLDANASRLLEVNLLDGNRKILAEDGQFDVAEVMTHPLKHNVEAVRFQRERSEWVAMDDTVAADFDTLSSISPGVIHVTSRTLDNQIWIVGFVVDVGSVLYYLYDRSAKQTEFIFSISPKLDNYKLSPMQAISYEARDGLKICGYLTVPIGFEARKDTAPPPMVLLIHGGPWGRDVWGYHSEVQWLANRGYSVLQINFRGSTGYGKEFCNAGNKEWGRKMHDDLIDGKRWAIENGYASEGNVAIFGWSYGGYATLVGVSFTPDEFNCGVAVVGPSNLVSLLESFPSYWEIEKGIFNKRIGNLETEREFLESCSPLFKANQIKAPLLIGQGANDPRVTQAESDQIVEVMRKNNLPVEYIVFEDEGHGFAKPQNRMTFYKIAETFLAKHLHGRLETH